jgi:hypothetical protein
MNTAAPKKAVTKKAAAKRAPPRKAVAKKPAAKPAIAAKLPAKQATRAVPPRATPAPSKARSVAIPAAKPRKPKLVRDSFTIPKAEYAAIDALKQRATQAGRTAKKSEVLRAGLMALAAMEMPAFLAALQAVPPIKTGRPAAAKRG